MWKNARSTIRHRDSNSQLLIYESPPLTTTPECDLMLNYSTLKQYSLIGQNLSHDLQNPITMLFHSTRLPNYPTVKFPYEIGSTAPVLSLCLDQRDQIGLFLKVLATDFLTKVAQILWQLQELFEKHHFKAKTNVATFWGILGKMWLLFTPTSGHT